MFTHECTQRKHVDVTDVSVVFCRYRVYEGQRLSDMTTAQARNTGHRWRDDNNWPFFRLFCLPSYLSRIEHQSIWGGQGYHHSWNSGKEMRHSKWKRSKMWGAKKTGQMIHKQQPKLFDLMKHRHIFVFFSNCQGYGGTVWRWTQRTLVSHVPGWASEFV